MLLWIGSPERDWEETDGYMGKLKYISFQTDKDILYVDRTTPRINNETKRLTSRW